MGFYTDCTRPAEIKVKLITLYVLGIENWYFIILSNSIPEDELISKPLRHPVMENPLRFHKILNGFFVVLFFFLQWELAS